MRLVHYLPEGLIIKIFVILITQNLFPKGKASRSISLNAHYIFLFKNPRDVTQVKYLASQMFPGKTHLLIEAFKDATTRPFGYLLIDCKQKTSDNCRLRTNILPSQWPITFYQDEEESV